MKIVLRLYPDSVHWDSVFSYLVPFILRSSLPGSEAPLHHHFCRQQHLMAVTHLTDTSPPHIFQSLHSWKGDCVFREKEGLKMPSLSKTWPFLSTCTAEAHPVAFTSSCLDLCTLSLGMINAALLFASIEHIAAWVILQPCCFDCDTLCNPSPIPLYHFKNKLLSLSS